MTDVRAFVAVELSPQVRQHLVHLGAAMAVHWPPGSVRWGAASALHLTLRFLGRMPRAALADVDRDLRIVAGRVSGFEVFLGPSGCFSADRQIRVIWVGVADPQGRLRRFQQEVEEVARVHGCVPETRAFMPHLTLGRVRAGTTEPVRDWLLHAQHLPLSVHCIHLMESRLQPEGACYRKLYTAELAAS